MKRRGMRIAGSTSGPFSTTDSRATSGHAHEANMMRCMPDARIASRQQTLHPAASCLPTLAAERTGAFHGRRLRLLLARRSAIRPCAARHAGAPQQGHLGRLGGHPATAEWLKEVYGGIESSDTFLFVISPMRCARMCAAASSIMRCGTTSGSFRSCAARRSRRRSPGAGGAKLIFFRDADDFDAASRTLAQALEIDLEWVRAHTRLLTRRWSGRVGRATGVCCSAAPTFTPRSDGSRSGPPADRPHPPRRRRSTSRPAVRPRPDGSDTRWAL